MMEFLKSFIIQAQTDDLRTRDYPKQFLGLKMKVSFGMGMPAKVPWIAFLAPGMSVSGGYYPVYLYYKEQDKLIEQVILSTANIVEEIQNISGKRIVEIEGLPSLEEIDFADNNGLK